MSTNHPSATVSAAPPQPLPPPPANPVRLIVLLAVLGLAIGALVYDFVVAGPGAEAAEKKLGEFVDARNKLGVKEGGQVTPDSVHKELAMQPTWVDKHNADHYEVEYYCWWGPVPVLNMRRHYLSVVYIGEDGQRHISSHYKNETPPREALPIIDAPPQSKEDQPIAAPETPDAAGPAQDAAPSAAKEPDAPAKSDDAPNK